MLQTDKFSCFLPENRNRMSGMLSTDSDVTDL